LDTILVAGRSCKRNGGWPGDMPMGLPGWPESTATRCSSGPDRPRPWPMRGWAEMAAAATGGGGLMAGAGSYAQGHTIGKER